MRALFVVFPENYHLRPQCRTTAKWLERWFTNPGSPVRKHFVILVSAWDATLAWNSLTHFTPVLRFIIETSHLFCRAKQMTAFYMKRITGLIWVKLNPSKCLPSIYLMTYLLKQVVVYMATNRVPFEIKHDVHIFPEPTRIVIAVRFGISKRFQYNIRLN